MEKQQKKPGRPKTKHYKTLMARISEDLVERVQQYAAQHQQNISALIRDALEVYISNEDFLSYRYRNTSDINKNASDTFEESTPPRITDTTRQELQEMVAAAVQAEIGKLQDFMGSAFDALKLSSAPEATAPQPTTQPAIPLALEPAPKTAHPVAVPQAAETPGTTAEPVPEPAQDDHTGGQEKGSQPRGRRSGPMRQRILALLAEHPEGLSPEQIRVYLNPEKPIGDVLQGMRRSGVVELRGEGYQKRYFVA
jgi:hypothetical protein